MLVANAEHDGSNVPAGRAVASVTTIWMALAAPWLRRADQVTSA
jgi:hypothetical protein